MNSTSEGRGQTALALVSLRTLNQLPDVESPRRKPVPLERFPRITIARWRKVLHARLMSEEHRYSLSRKQRLKPVANAQSETVAPESGSTSQGLAEPRLRPKYHGPSKR